MAVDSQMAHAQLARQTSLSTSFVAHFINHCQCRPYVNYEFAAIEFNQSGRIIHLISQKLYKM